jgi:hypothetical protein
MSNAVLGRLIDDNSRFDLANRGTVNHLPMALYALSQLGASDARLEAYFRWWEENRSLPRRPSPRAISGDEWRDAIGQADMFDALATAFRRWADEAGPDAVICEIFPVVADGVAAAAFHGLIRLAYGIEAGHNGEIAAGLATLCARHAPLGASLGSAPEVASAEAGFTRLAVALDGGARFTGQGIIGRMQAAAADLHFVAALSRLPLSPPGVLADLAGLAIRLYWQTGDFTVLHMVTTCHAGRVVFARYPHLATKEAAEALWLAACAAYASIGAPFPEPPGPPAGELPDWPAIRAGAVACNDDHVVKMTYTCLCEEGHYGDPLYRAVAARLVAAGKSQPG